MIPGITTSFTKSPGTGGVIKHEPSDFIVQEILIDGTVCSLEPETSHTPHTSEYTHFTLVKRDWNQDTVLKNIARLCGQSRKRLTYAGTKDKFALTSQRIAAWKLLPEQLAQVRIKDTTLGDFAPGVKKLDLGDLWGNRFTINIKNAEHPENLGSKLKEIKKIGGIPNFFGEQRFGNRQNNHEVGKAIIDNDIETAIKIFLTEGEDTLPEGNEARKLLKENWGSFNEALVKFPNYMRFEKALLNHLVQHPSDYVGAFKKLSKNMYKIFTHSYQSYIFNQELSEKIKNNESLEGAGTLPGYDNGRPEFKVKSFPEASCKGQPRKYLAEMKNLEHKVEDSTITLKFDLEKGAYATILLRAILE
ncbi:MAG: tRNA pseudouridine(13) synthase TruD [archaeon]